MDSIQSVIPAEAGIQVQPLVTSWIPAFAGMTKFKKVRLGAYSLGYTKVELPYEAERSDNFE